MATASINRKSAQSQVSTWQDVLRDYKAQMTSKKMQQTQQNNGTGHGQNNHTFPRSERDLTTSAHKVKPDSDRTPQKSTGVKINASEPQESTSQTAKQNPGQERVRPEGMTRVQWKNLKSRRRVLAFWPELFNLDNPKPLKTGVLNDLMQDIAARNLAVGTGALKAAIASYTRRVRYKKALAAGGARYDLNGQPCGEVTPEQQQEAADELKNRDNG
ncbi:TPA: ProQ/FINO family protein [Salmonella enterica subsp. diarizonae serovar 61:r:-]